MKHFFTLLMTIFWVSSYAQKTMIANIAGVEEATTLKNSITQHNWNKYEWIDTCCTRYAIVHDWYGRCGIYDLEIHENITELEYRDLNFMRMMELEDGNQAAMFYGLIGHRKGIVSVGTNNDVAILSMIDEEMSYTLDSCRTIDKKITRLCRKLLEKDMKEAGGLYGQVFVMESQTGYIKTWMALEDKFHNGKISEAPLLKKQCSNMPLKPIFAINALVESNMSWNDSVDTKNGIDSIANMMIMDYNWHKGGFGKVSFLDGFKLHSDIAMVSPMAKAYPIAVKHYWNEATDKPRETDAMQIASIYNNIALEGKRIIEPSVNTDSIKIREIHDITESDYHTIHMAKEYLYATLHNGGIGSKWTNPKVNIVGDYTTHRNCRPTIYDDNAKDMERYFSEEGLTTYNQVIFAGYFPADNPQYTICVTMENEGLPLSGRTISKTVNKLTEYLYKYLLNL